MIGWFDQQYNREIVEDRVSDMIDIFSSPMGYNILNEIYKKYFDNLKNEELDND
jgi:hypothetical protein